MSKTQKTEISPIHLIIGLLGIENLISIAFILIFAVISIRFFTYAELIWGIFLLLLGNVLIKYYVIIKEGFIPRDREKRLFRKLSVEFKSLFWVTTSFLAVCITLSIYFHQIGNLAYLHFFAIASLFLFVISVISWLNSNGLNRLAEREFKTMDLFFSYGPQLFIAVLLGGTSSYIAKFFGISAFQDALIVAIPFIINWYGLYVLLLYQKLRSSIVLSFIERKHELREKYFTALSKVNPELEFQIRTRIRENAKKEESFEVLRPFLFENKLFWIIRYLKNDSERYVAIDEDGSFINLASAPGLHRLFLIYQACKVREKKLKFAEIRKFFILNLKRRGARCISARLERDEIDEKEKEANEKALSFGYQEILGIELNFEIQKLINEIIIYPIYDLANLLEEMIKKEIEVLEHAIPLRKRYVKAYEEYLSSIGRTFSMSTAEITLRKLETILERHRGLLADFERRPSQNISKV